MVRRGPWGCQGCILVSKVLLYLLLLKILGILVEKEMTLKVRLLDAWKHREARRYLLELCSRVSRVWFSYALCLTLVLNLRQGGESVWLTCGFQTRARMHTNANSCLSACLILKLCIIAAHAWLGRLWSRTAGNGVCSDLLCWLRHVGLWVSWSPAWGKGHRIAAAHRGCFPLWVVRCLLLQSKKGAAADNASAWMLDTGILAPRWERRDCNWMVRPTAKSPFFFKALSFGHLTLKKKLAVKSAAFLLSFIERGPPCKRFSCCYRTGF